VEELKGDIMVERGWREEAQEREKKMREELDQFQFGEEKKRIDEANNNSIRRGIEPLKMNNSIIEEGNREDNNSIEQNKNEEVEEENDRRKLRKLIAALKVEKRNHSNLQRVSLLPSFSEILLSFFNSK